MKKRLSDEQIINILKEAEADLAVKDLCRKYNISDATLYARRKKFGGMEVSEARRLKTVEDEKVIPPFLTGFKSRPQAAMANFC